MIELEGKTYEELVVGSFKLGFIKIKNSGRLADKNFSYIYDPKNPGVQIDFKHFLVVGKMGNKGIHLG